MTDMPLPCQSTNSSRACAITSAGSAAGPGEKLKTGMASPSVPLGPLGLGTGPIVRGVAVAGSVALAGFVGSPVLDDQTVDTFEACQLIALLEADQAHALRVAPHDRNILDRSAHQSASLAHEHDLIIEAHLQRTDHASVAVRHLQSNDALAAAAVSRKVFERREFAVAVFGSGQDKALVGHDERIDALIVAEANAAHPGGLAAHRAHFVLDESNRLSACRKQQNIATAVGDRGTDQLVALVERDRYDAIGARAGKQRKRGLLDGPETRRHEDVLAFLEFLDREHRADALAFLQRQQIDDRLAARTAARLRQLVDLHPIEFSVVRETQQRVVRIGDEQLVDEILVL